METINERIIHRHCAMGSGIVRVVGSRCSGKTSTVLRYLTEQSAKKVTTAKSTTPLVAYVSCMTSGSLRELGQRVATELLSEAQDVAPAVDKRMPNDITDLLLAAVNSARSHVHVVLDDVDSVLSPATASEIGCLVGQWYAGVQYSRRLTFWLLSCTDFSVPHASRLMVLAAPTSQEKAVWIDSTANPSSALGLMVAHVGSTAVRTKPMQDTAFAADLRRVMSRCETIAAVATPATLSAFEHGTQAAKMEKTVEAWFRTVPPVATDSAASSSTVAAKLMFVAAFLAGALSKTQLAAVLGDGSAVGRKAKRNGPTVVRPGSQVVTVARLMLAYDGIGRMWQGPPPPPSRVALHHLAAMEAQGGLVRSTHNHATYSCRISTEEATSMAANMGLDLSQLLPTQVA